jgi:dCTP deaminase
MIVVDGELQRLIQHPINPLLTDFDPPYNWQDKGSLVQPCSLDLHIGAIFVPGIKPGKPGSAGNPKTELVLKTGQTAIVSTKESIHLPNDYAGFGFPPSNISARALLMTNPGHIDPGFSGPLQFTVINMGREDYILQTKAPIVTLLIFKLGTQVDADYASRRQGRITTAIEQTNIDILSPDFVDVQNRATHIARKTLGYATVGASVLALIVGWAFNAIDKRIEGIDDITTRLTRLEDKNVDLANQLKATKEQLESKMDFDHRLVKIESKDLGGRAAQ